MPVLSLGVTDLIKINRFHSFLMILTMSVCAMAQAPEVDITFGGAGLTLSDPTPEADSGKEVLIQSDGKIIVAGDVRTNVSPRYFGITRFNTNGTLDTTFGENGVMLTDFNASAPNEGVAAAALQADDKIVVAGYVSIFSPGEGYFAIVRYNANGSLDTTFGSGGKVIKSFGNNHINEATDVTITPDGKILVSGRYFANGTSFQTGIVRLSSSGVEETSMVDQRGFTLGSSNVANAVTVQPDGKIVAAGSYNPNQSGVNSQITVIRYNPNGTFDPTFAGTGRFMMDSPENDFLTDVVVLPSGKILACGSIDGNFLLVRLYANGALDKTFAGNIHPGMVSTPMGGNAVARKLIVRPNGNILVVGESDNGIAIAYYTSYGVPDNSFSGDGKLTFNFPGNSTVARSIAIDSIGRILLGGSSALTVNNSAFSAVRLYTLDPVPVSIVGRAITPQGNPVRGLEISFTDASGLTRYAYTSSLGYFQLDNVPTGQTYNLSVSSKKFIVQSRNIGLNEAINDLELIATPNEQLGGGKSGGKR